MSSTNRGRKREPRDFYETPSWLVEPMVRALGGYFFVMPRLILEPARGDGAITRVLQSAFPDAQIVEGDIATGEDFLTYDYACKFDLVMTNPPFELMMKFVQRGLYYCAPGGLVVMLGRLNWLGSQSRAQWFRDHPPSVYITPRRPDFTHGGGDSCEYAWFTWGESRQRLVWLRTEDSARQEKLFARRAG